MALFFVLSLPSHIFSLNLQAKHMSQRNLQIQEQTQGQVQVQQMLPQQVMLVRLMEMPVEALQHRVELECMENPWLEKKEEDNSQQTTDNGQANVDDAAFDYQSEYPEVINKQP